MNRGNGAIRLGESEPVDAVWLGAAFLLAKARLRDAGLPFNFLFAAREAAAFLAALATAPPRGVRASLFPGELC